MTAPVLITQAAQARAEKDLQTLLEATTDVVARRVIFARLYDAVTQDLTPTPLYTLAWAAWIGEHAADHSGDVAIAEHVTQRPISGQFDQAGSAG